MNVKECFMDFGLFKVKDGSQTRFWIDTWLGNKPLKDKFPALFNIVRRKQDSVAQVLSSTLLNISFRRNLVGANLTNWHRIVASLQVIHLTQEKDVFVWGLHASGSYTVKSMYVQLINNGVRVSQDLWQIKVPMKIKVFLWYLKKGVILTKDNLVRRNWNGDRNCCFCHSPETIQHLFLHCTFCQITVACCTYTFWNFTPCDINDLFIR